MTDFALVSFARAHWELLSITAVSGTMLLWPLLSGQARLGIAATEAVLLFNRKGALFVDVREPQEFAAAHQHGAHNVPLARLSTETGRIAPDKQTPIVLVCQSGHRTPAAARQLRKQGYARVHTLTGGLNAWRSAGLPLKEPGARKKA